MIRVVVFSLDLNVKTAVEENFKFVTEECVRVKVKSPELIEFIQTKFKYCLFNDDCRTSKWIMPAI